MYTTFCFHNFYSSAISEKKLKIDTPYCHCIGKTGKKLHRLSERLASLGINGDLIERPP